MPHFVKAQEATIHKIPATTRIAFFQTVSMFRDFVGTRRSFEVDRFYFHLRSF
jgi:hypothetical protein